MYDSVVDVDVIWHFIIRLTPSLKKNYMTLNEYGIDLSVKLNHEINITFCEILMKKIS